MRIVRLVFWLLLAFAFLAFAAANWTAVTMIFGRTEVVVRLPLLLLVVGFAGYVMASLRYRMRPRDAAVAYVAPAPAELQAQPRATLPSEAQPIVVPPGCG
ncbi:hypothetical protein [Glacieibacterium frigidum]|uniref:DUF1049 domain-containing protein n=1 Tax=Glacieibacterium frigidum TaxID=2593303 RepID=A0A552UF52_9SPHN|nr:hypothetical protein [Glacieibacterium frigidum]TRW16858.1 hypothetical protein FMM06_01215 [Glacieibacterium frigidum]